MSTLLFTTSELPQLFEVCVKRILQRNNRLYGILFFLFFYAIQPVFAQINEHTLPIQSDLFYYNKHRIAIEENRAFVGNSLGIHVFEFDGTDWNEQAFIPELNQFVVSGNRLVTGLDTIKVYEYNGSTWGVTDTLSEPVGDGIQIAIDGDRIVCAKSYPSEARIYIYENNGSEWVLTDQIVKVLPSIPSPIITVAISGNQFVLTIRKTMLIYEYNGSDWIEADEIETDVFNSDIDGNRITINNKVYEKSGGVWAKTAELIPDRAKGGYGSSFSLSGNLIALVSTADGGADASGESSGAMVSVFEHTGGQWIERVSFAKYFEGDVELSGKNMIYREITSGKVSIYMLDDFSNPDFAKVTAFDGSSKTELGRSVAMVLDKAIVGAPYDDEKGTDAGAVYIYQKNGSSWEQVAKITAADAAAGDHFGWSVSMNETIYEGLELAGTYVTVGSPGADDLGESSGAAYVFKLDSGQWLQQVKLTATDGAAGDQFGFSVTNVGIGAPYHDSDGISNSGSVYLYRMIPSGAEITNELTAAKPKKGDLFGWSMDYRYTYDVYRNTFMHSPRFIVGAPRDDEKGTDAGAAYVYLFHGLSPYVQKLTASDGAPFDRFGTSVSVEGENAVVGAPLKDNVGNASGAAYLFHTDFYYDPNNDIDLYSDWYETAKLTASDAAIQDRFGYSVYIAGKKVAIGSPFADHAGGINAGAAYVYALEDSAWIEKGKETGDAHTGDFLGWSVASNIDQVIASAHGDDDKGNKAGAAYIFSVYNLSDLPATAAPLARTNHEEEQATKAQLEQVEAIKNPLAGIREMKIYPNSFAQRLSIKLDQDQAEAVEITLMDQLGRTLYHRAFTATESQQLLDIDVTTKNQLPSGMIFLGIKTSQVESKWFRLLKK